MADTAMDDVSSRKRKADGDPATRTEPAKLQTTTEARLVAIVQLVRHFETTPDNSSPDKRREFWAKTVALMDSILDDEDLIARINQSRGGDASGF
jgi:hypothetical protein